MVTMSAYGRAWGLLVAGIVAAPAAADVVHLANGRQFEGVVASASGDSVRIRFEFGEIALPARLVASVEKGGSALAEFEERYAALAGRGTASAEDWLELARWARARGLDHGAARAALQAVEFTPEPEGAAALLAALGLVRDEASGQWLRYEEAMSRQGLVPFRGAWVTRAEAAALLAAEAREREELATAYRDDRLTRAVELLALAQLAEATTAWPPVIGVPLFGFPVVVSPGFVHVRPHVTPLPWAPGQEDVLDDLLHRNPGSLLPVGDPRRVIRSRFSSAGLAPGSAEARLGGL